MRKSSNAAIRITGAGALALLMASATFAAPSRGDHRGATSSHRSYRENERFNVSGKISSFSRERDGYRVQLDRGRDSYWIPSSRIRNRSSFRVGVSIVLGGVYRGGRYDIDDVNWPVSGGYRDDYVRGIVARIDFRSGTLLLRDASSGRTIDVDMRDTARSSRVDLNDLRRGDSITLTGEWYGGGRFIADRIDSVSSGRW